MVRSRSYTPVDRPPVRRASFAAFVALLAALAQAIVPFIHALESQPSHAATEIRATEAPIGRYERRAPQAGMPGHDAEHCAVCKAVRDATRPTLDTGGASAWVLAAATGDLAPATADPVSRPVLRIGLARGPPVVC